MESGRSLCSVFRNRVDVYRPDCVRSSPKIYATNEYRRSYHIETARLLIITNIALSRSSRSLFEGTRNSNFSLKSAKTEFDPSVIVLRTAQK